MATANTITNSNESSPPVDMSCRIGGRVVRPLLRVVDGSFPSTAAEAAFEARLQAYAAEHVPVEDSDSMRTRELALSAIGSICREWIVHVYRSSGLPEEAVAAAGGQLFTSGSFRLGVHEPGADIDTIVVAPSGCRREDFFGILPGGGAERDPRSLAGRLRRRPEVTNFNAVENAAVPILTFDWESVNFDLAFARLSRASVPERFDVNRDDVLDGVDTATEKSLNGPRVTNLIYELVSGTPQRYRNFLTCVRCVRKWAKARGLYSNKMGYWGGVNINIACALVVQLYPNANASTLLRRFFLVFRSWRWPQPVMLTDPHDAGLGLPVWSRAGAGGSRGQVAPMITPAYPAMNSSSSVSRQTLRTLHEEICRGHDIIDRVWRGGDDDDDDDDDRQHRHHPMVEATLEELFRPADFFLEHSHYLALCVVGPTAADAQAWAGFVESRLRRLVSESLGRSLPLSRARLWPRPVAACCADPSALLARDQRRFAKTYFVGVDVDALRTRGDSLNVEGQMHAFRKEDLSRFRPLVPGMDVLVRAYRVKELPRLLFAPPQYENKEAAMRRRRALRDADPARVARRRTKRLERLKRKREELERNVRAKRLKQNDDDGGTVTNDDDDDKDKDKDKDKEGATEGGAESTGVDVDGADGDGDVKEETAAAAEVKTENPDDDGESAPRPPTTTSSSNEEALQLERALDAVQDQEAERTTTEAAVAAAVVDPEERKRIAARQEAEILREAGYVVVNDDDDGDETKGAPRVVLRPSASSPSSSSSVVPSSGAARPPPVVGTIRFSTKFAMVELDEDGRVMDKGDEDFTPSRKWIGRKGGFEFKLGERGLGYYRTGKKVVVPSNTAY